MAPDTTDTGGRRTAAPLGASEPIRVELELDRGSEPISGRVLLSEEDVPFKGWLGLANALQQGLAAEDAAHE